MGEILEVFYMDGIAEVFEIPPGIQVVEEPAVLRVGPVVIERRNVRRWRTAPLPARSEENQDG